MVVGLWPHQSTRIRSGILCFIIVGGFCQLIPQILAIVKYHDDWDFLLKSASPLAFEATVIIRVLSSTCNRQKVSYTLAEQAAVNEIDEDTLRTMVVLCQK